MSFMEKIVTIPRIFGAIFLAFIALLGMRVTYPIISGILDLWTGTSMMKTVAYIIMYLIYFFLLWIVVWMKLFEPQINNKGGDM